jgi:hypothetical protein
MSVIGSTIEDMFTLGTILAVVLSWDRNRSIFYAVIHGTFGWVYMIYLWLTGELNRL